MTKSTKTADIIIIGAGLHGSSIALHLAMRNQRVLLLDHGSGGRHSSKVSAGGLRQLIRDEAEIPLAIEALKIWQNIRDLVDDDCGVGFSGQVCVAENADELKTFGSPFRSTFAFQNKAESLGVEFLRNAPVSSIQQAGESWAVHITDGRKFEAPVVVNCAGAWGDKIAAMVGDTVPISPESPMMMISAPIAPFLKPVVIGTGKKLSFKQAPNGIVLIGGGHRGSLNRDTGETHIDFSRLKMSASTVIDLFPHMANVPIVRSWGGIEGLTPDKIPVMGKSMHANNIYHSFGYSSHGYLLAPLTGRLMSELIIDGAPSISIDAFNMSRFMLITDLLRWLIDGISNHLTHR